MGAGVGGAALVIRYETQLLSYTAIPPFILFHIHETHTVAGDRQFIRHNHGRGRESSQASWRNWWDIYLPLSRSVSEDSGSVGRIPSTSGMS